MQEQMMQAIAGVVGQAAAIPSGPAAASREAPGRRLLAAMVTAQKGECACHPCVLLRDELSGLLAGFLEQAAAAPAEAPPTVGAPLAAPAPTTAVEVL